MGRYYANAKETLLAPVGEGGEGGRGGGGAGDRLPPAVESPAGGRGGPSESDRLGEVRLIHAPAAQASALGSRPLDFRP